jgi:predicted phage terminase large subunit-like protein
VLDQPLSQATIQIPTNFLLELEASICRDSLYQFVKMAWYEVEQDPFVDGWHIRAICEALEALYYDRIDSNNLILNVPPRHMKSLLVDVFFPAWVWTREAHKKFLCLSYAESTISSIMAKTKKLLKSIWYQEHFNIPMASSPDTNTRFANIYGGYIYSFGFSGAVTGEGGDFLLIDDPLKATDADSDLVRNKVNDDYDNAIANRLNNPMTGKRIIIMQRLHERDLIGHLISKKIKFEHIIFPFEYEGERFQSSIGITDIRTQAGELLWKERFTSQEKLDEYKNTYSDERAKAGQLQQRPSPEGGFIFKREWFPRISQNDSVAGVYISWDTAGSLLGAYSCGVVGELRADNTLFPKEVVRKQILFPQLQQEIEQLATKYQHNLKAVIIENKSSGIQAVQTLKQQSPSWLADKIMAFNPKGAKDARQYQAASFCEKGCVLLPYPSLDLPWLPDFEEEIFSVPGSPYKDQADAFSQLIWYLRIFLTLGWQARTSNQRKPIQLEGVF